MNILIVGNTTSQNFTRLKQEGEKRDHTLSNCHSHNLVLNTSPENFTPQINQQPITNFDLIYLLAVGKRKWNWYLTCHYLKETQNTTIVESKYIDPSYLLFFTPASELLKQYQNQLSFPKTTILLSPEKARLALKDHSYPLIIKTGGQRGEGVFKAKNQKQALKIIHQNKTSHSFQIKQFIPNNGDIRIFTVGYQTIGAMHRLPPNNSFKSNISQGGTGQPFDLQKHPQVKSLAEEVSRLNHTEIAGIDIIIHKKTQQPYILEVNRGPQFTGLEKYTNTNAALSIIKYFEQKRSQAVK